ncbi:MAG: hypothetical protein B6I24_02870 [Bacteroidetes bacterium 4572_128]|nr:MAG: hypothetical protein B6I24_02870 [Bacteroidetes bacterium 4572_128]
MIKNLIYIFFNGFKKSLKFWTNFEIFFYLKSLKFCRFFEKNFFYFKIHKKISLFFLFFLFN